MPRRPSQLEEFMKFAWVIEGEDEQGTWWVGLGVIVERSLEGAMRFHRRDIAERYASAVKAKVYQVAF
jgi:hypothetical protein